MKRNTKPSLTDISPINANSLQYKTNYDFNYCSEYVANQQHYADDFLNQQVPFQEAKNESGFHERLANNRKCFVQFTETIGQLKEVPLNIKDTIISKQIPSNFPNFQELVKLYEKDIQKMQITKTLKKNWNEDDIIILIWCVMKYCAHQAYDPYKQLTEGDWEFISNMIPGKDKESCRFKWLKMCKVNIQDEPWTKEENDLLPIIVHQVQETGKKDWVEVSSRLYYETQQKTYRTPKQCREHFNNYHDPDIKKGSWTQEEDIELLKLAQELGKKWSVIAKKLRGRTENAVKNRFHAIFRKHMESSAGGLGVDSADDGSPKVCESEEISSDHNNSPNGAAQIDSNVKQSGGDSMMSSQDLRNERKMISQLIKNLEVNLKINSSGYYSSDNNSVYSDSSRNSKVLQKQKSKHQKFIKKNYESMSSDDDNSKPSPSPVTAQKSIFGKAYADSSKCKQDDGDDAAADENNRTNHNQLQLPAQQYLSQFSNNNPQRQENNIRATHQSSSSQNKNAFAPSQFNPTPSTLNEGISTNYQYSQHPHGQQQHSYQTKQQQQTFPVNQNIQVNNTNLDFFNQQIVLGTASSQNGTTQNTYLNSTNQEHLNQNKDQLINGEDYMPRNNQYQEFHQTSVFNSSQLPNGSSQQPQNNNNRLPNIQPKIGSLDHIDIQEELKLRIMNYTDFVYDPNNSYQFAIVNVSKNEIYQVPSSHNSTFTKLLPTKVPQIEHNSNNLKQNYSSSQQSQQYQPRTTNSSSIERPFTHTIRPEIDQQVVVTHNQITNQRSIHDQKELTQNIINSQNTPAPTTQGLATQSGQLPPQQSSTNHQQHYYNDYQNPQTPQQVQQMMPTQSALPTHSQLVGIQSFGNPAPFQVISNIPQQIGQMKIEDNSFFILPTRNGFNMQSNTHHNPQQQHTNPLISYTSDPTNTYNQQQNLNYQYASSGQHPQQQSHQQSIQTQSQSQQPSLQMAYPQQIQQQQLYHTQQNPVFNPLVQQQYQ